MSPSSFSPLALFGPALVVWPNLGPCVYSPILTFVLDGGRYVICEALWKPASESQRDSETILYLSVDFIGRHKSCGKKMKENVFIVVYSFY